MNLKGSKTEKNLKDAFAGESQANRRYLYFAAKADVEGFNDVSAVFRSTAEGETGSRPRSSGISGGRGRSGDRIAHRRDLVEPEGRHRRRDARIHRHVSRHGQERPRGRLQRNSRLVRDAGKSRALACQSLPKGVGQSLSPASRRPAGRRNPSGLPAGARYFGTGDSLCPTDRSRKAARAVSRPPRGTRSAGRTPNSTTRPPWRRSSSGSSTSATAAVAASTSATPSRRCSI